MQCNPLSIALSFLVQLQLVLPVDGHAAVLGPGGEHLGQRGKSGELLEMVSIQMASKPLYFLSISQGQNKILIYLTQLDEVARLKRY